MARDPDDDDPTPFQVVAPARDELTREVAMAQLKRRLFDRDVAVKIGRYQLLEVVGQGGMGVVWGAWDPELDRKVAIKLVRPSVPAARERILVEGQALAKLSHPNVVPIYDVGTLDEQVYLVMELVRGANLRIYASEPRGIRELVAVYREAGEGLAAAHAAGLVHRDFKPENAIRGDADGRVRVVDFGLAQSADDDGEIAGTPRYMAPEHAAGAPATAASDQFSFCVALREAITGSAGSKTEVAVPRWIDAIVARGARPDPAQRFPSMRALLQALARDPRRVWRIRAAVALTAIAVAIAFVIGWSRGHDTAPDLCAGAEDEVAIAWGTDLRTKVAAHLAPLGEVKVIGDLDAYRTSWTGAHRAACLAHRGGELPVSLYERRLGCLARARASLGAVAELLVQVSRERLDNALVAAHSLPDPAHCRDHDDAQILPPAASVAAEVQRVASAVERARVLAVAVEPGAERIARDAVRDAEATRYKPVIGRALLVQGRAEMAIDDPGAEATLARAVELGIEAGDDPTAIEAFARQLFVAARANHPVDGRSLIEPLALRAGPGGAPARALLYNNLATGRLAANDRDGARALLLEARAQLPGDPADTDIELVCIAQGLALVAPTDAERERQLGSVATTLRRVLGERHVNTLLAQSLHAMATPDGRLARQRQAAACSAYQRWKPLAPELPWCELELAWLADEVDDVAAATAAMQLVRSDPQPERHYRELATGYLALAAGDLTAENKLRALGAELGASPQLWQRVTGADAYVVVARGAERRGQPRVAVTAWAAALAILESLDHPMYQRRITRVRAALARHLAATDPGEARRLAGLARAWYTAAGGYDAQLASLPR